MPALSLLIKPASANCNLRCRYCFYADEAAHRAVPSFGLMSLATLETVVRKALSYATRDCTFAFQGGEPTLVGLDFYRQLVSFVALYNTKKLTVHYALQTNGTLLDGEWARFLGEHHFLVGLSLDGVKDFHDRYRLDAAQKGTFSKVMHAVQLLEGAGVEYNILTVVTAQLARGVGRVYGFYRRNHLEYQQYIPCLDPLGVPCGQEPYSLTPALYGDFLISLFDLWYQDISRGIPVSIRYFDNLVLLLRGYPPESCAMTGRCTLQQVVEADGEVYPCDFYVLDDYKLGNLTQCGFQEVAARYEAIGFQADSLLAHPACGSCPWQALCRGGCRRNRDLGQGPLALNYFCPAYRRFFDYAYPRLSALARAFPLGPPR